MHYYTLIASLPHLPAHFDVERSPITRPQLEERLRMLSEEDDRVLQQLTDFLAWDRQPLDRTDEQVVGEYERLHQTIHNPLIRELVDHRIDVRTIVSALRRHRRGDGPRNGVVLLRDGHFGVGRLVEHIRRNWQRPHFHLQRRYPWIEEFEEHMSAGQAVAAERVLLQATWDVWCRLATEYTFSFEAVVLYLARWEVVHRWTSLDADAGRTRFDKLIEETLGEYASLPF